MRPPRAGNSKRQHWPKPLIAI